MAAAEVAAPAAPFVSAMPPVASFETRKRYEEALRPPPQQLEALQVRLRPWTASDWRQRAADMPASSLRACFRLLQNLILPHIESFNGLFRDGLAAALADLEPVEVTDTFGNKLRCTTASPARPIISCAVWSC